ncbi:phosphotriesterase [Kutzneria sp. NPDC052558]|uniref:phosphotriesterase n=1 Tax=Kutzneria sp. NPDC052558 TaxID=3364121 RepID=UPI0037CA622C
MSAVETVRGRVDGRALGRVLMHEHVFVVNEEYRRNYPESWDEEARFVDAVTRLRELKARGVDTIVDPTVLGLGRDVSRLTRINHHVDLNIVVATGVYTLRDVPFVFRYHGPGTLLGGPEPMVDLFVRDITEGIANTGVKAAVLKCAVEDELTPGVERVMVAVAEAHKRTGVPIMVHTSPTARTGSAALAVFRREGVRPEALLLSHSNDTADVDYLTELADSGAYLGMDRFGVDVLLPHEDRVNTLVSLVDKGLADRMVLSQDASCHIDWFPPGAREAALPNWRYTHILDDVLPALRAAGVSERDIDLMLVDNPRRILAGA